MPEFEPNQPFDVQEGGDGVPFDASKPFETDGGGAPAAPPKRGGLGRNFRAGFTEGITGIPGLLADAGASDPGFADFSQQAAEHGQPEINQPHGADLTHSLNQGLGAIGLNPEDVSTEGFGENVARIAGAGATSLLFPEVGLERAGAAAAPKLLENVVPRLANSPLATLARRGATGAAVGAGAGAGGQAVPDSMPELKLPVEMLTAIAMGTAAELPGVVKAGAQRAGTLARPFTEQGRQDIAADTLRSRAENPAMLATQLDKAEPDLVTGSQPTTFQKSGDMGIGALERQQATKHPADFNKRRADQNQARMNALTAIQEGGDPAAVGTFLRGQFRAFDDQAQQHLDALTAHAQQKAEGLGGSGHPEEHGAAMRAALQDAENSARARERSLWKSVDPDNTVRIDAGPTFKSAKDIEAGLSKFAKPMDGEEAAIHQTLQGNQHLSLGELADLRSRVSTALRKELSENGQTPAYARLSRLRGAIQNNLADAAAGKAAQDAQAVAAGTMAADDALTARVQGWANEFFGKRAAQSRASGAEGVSGRAAGRHPNGPGDDGTGLPPEGGPGSAAGDSGIPKGERTLTGPSALENMTREEFLGNPRITSNKNASDLKPRALTSLDDVREEPFLNGRFTVKYSPDGAAVFDGDRPVASYNFGDTLAVDKKYRRQGIAEELVYQWRKRFPAPGVAKDRTATAQKIQEKVWDRISREHAASGPEIGSPAGPRVLDSDDAERLAAATKATKERAATFGRGPTQQVLAKAGAQDAYKLPEARVPEKFFHAGPTSHQDIQTLRQTVGDEAALPILRDYAAASLRRFAETADGTLDPRKVQAWQRKYGNALRAFPDLNAQFTDAASATDAIAAAAKAQKTALADRNASALGRVIKAEAPEDVTRTIGSMFSRNDSTKAFQTLVTAIKGRARSPSAGPRDISFNVIRPSDRPTEAMEGLRQAVADHIAKKFISNTEAGTSGTNLFKADAFQSFVKQNRGALSSVFSPEEMKTLDAIAADLHRANRSITAVKLPGSSNTAQDAHAIIANNPDSTIFSRAVSEGTAAAIGAKMGNVTGAGIGWLGAKVVNAARSAGMEKVDDLVTRALLDPEFARDLLRRPPKKIGDRQSAKLAARMRRIGAGLMATEVTSRQRAGNPDR